MGVNNIRSTEREIVKRYFHNQELNMMKWGECFGAVRDKIVVHIPARSGSSRIENKNVADICGLPLIAYTIKIAKALPVDRVIVNTDSEEYAEIAAEYGAEVPFIRPKELSDAVISPGFASFYAKRWLMDEKYPVDLFIDMYPTNPFRNVQKINGYVRKALECGLLYTRSRIGFNPERLYFGDSSLKESICKEPLESFSFFKVLSSFMAHKMSPDDIKWYIYSNIDDPIELIDVDSPSDLELARHVVRERIYDFGVEL